MYVEELHANRNYPRTLLMLDKILARSPLSRRSLTPVDKERRKMNKMKRKTKDEVANEIRADRKDIT